MEGIAEVQHTQAKNTRAKGAKTYHLVVSFRPEDEDKLSPEMFRKMEERFSVPSLEHQEARIELRRLKGDLGRLGGLVKQALADGADRQTVHRLLHELDARQRELQQAIAAIK